jgi:hypothetical protein
MLHNEWWWSDILWPKFSKEIPCENLFLLLLCSGTGFPSLLRQTLLLLCLSLFLRTKKETNLPVSKSRHQKKHRDISEFQEPQFIERMDASKNMQNISTIIGKCSIPDKLYLILHESWVEIKYELCMIRLELFLWNTLRNKRWTHNLQWPGLPWKVHVDLVNLWGKQLPFSFYWSQLQYPVYLAWCGSPTVPICPALARNTYLSTHT